MSADWKTVYTVLYLDGVKTTDQINAVSSTRLTDAEKTEVLAAKTG